MPNPIWTERTHWTPPRAPRAPDPDYFNALALFRELIRIEHWLRHQAELAIGDSRLAARLDRGADHVEQAANRVKDRSGLEVE